MFRVPRMAPCAPRFHADVASVTTFRPSRADDAIFALEMHPRCGARLQGVRCPHPSWCLLFCVAQLCCCLVSACLLRDGDRSRRTAPDLPVTAVVCSFLQGFSVDRGIYSTSASHMQHLQTNGQLTGWSDGSAVPVNFRRVGCQTVLQLANGSAGATLHVPRVVVLAVGELGHSRASQLAQRCINDPSVGIFSRRRSWRQASVVGFQRGPVGRSLFSSAVGWACEDTNICRCLCCDAASTPVAGAQSSCDTHSSH